MGRQHTTSSTDLELRSQTRTLAFCFVGLLSLLSGPTPVNVVQSTLWVIKTSKSLPHPYNHFIPRLTFFFYDEDPFSYGSLPSFLSSLTLPSPLVPSPLLPSSLPLHSTNHKTVRVRRVITLDRSWSQSPPFMLLLLSIVSPFFFLY